MPTKSQRTYSVTVRMTRDEVLALAADRHDDERRRLDLLSVIAEFQLGDEVRHIDAARDPVNRCVVEDLRVVGFPEYVGRDGDTSALALLYVLDCPGPMGVGRETIEDWEDELCVATVRRDPPDEAVVGEPEIERARGASSDEIQGRLLKVFLRLG